MTAVERVAEALDAVAEQSGLGAFWALDDDGARRAADAVDRRIARGAQAGALAGTPVGVKDCFDLAGLPTTCGVPGPARVAARDAEVVRRLRAAGAVPVGKTAMDQLGWATSGRAPARPACRNPRDGSRSPGGSSAGSAVAVAASIVPLAIGTDTAGSVRVPAAYCGVVGLKAGLGALPRRGLATVVPSLESVGVLTRTVGECRAAYEALTRRPIPAAGDVRLVVGRLDDLFETADPSVAAVCGRALDALASRHRVAPARLDWQPRGLGRLFAADLDRTWGARIRERPHRFMRGVREGVQRGAAVTEAERLGVLEGLGRARRRLRRRLQAFDVVACPTVPHPVPVAGEESVDACTRFTRPFNALGWPAISIPCGTDPLGLPIGVQLAAPPARLPALLAIAAAVEAVAPAA